MRFKWSGAMSYFLIEYLEQRIAACDQMIVTGKDADTLRIFEATRERYRRDIEQPRRESTVPVR